jgi:ribosomal protein S1
MIEPPRVDWQELKQEQVHTGTVTRIEPYGVFVDIGAERPGLLHVREMSTGYVRHPSELVKIGEQVEVRILGLDRRKRRIDLSMMGITVEDNPEDDEEEVPVKTAMEAALERAQSPRQQGHERRHQEKPPSPDISERGDILTRTIKQHSKRQ